MSLYRDEGIVLRTFRLGEADRIVTLMTRGRGKVRAVAKGVRRTHSKFGARLEPLSHVTMMCWQGRELDIVNQAEVLDTFRVVREDLSRVNKAYTVLEVVDQLAQERHANPRLYEMVLGALRVLEEQDAPLLVAAFLLKVLALEGSAPTVDVCVSCGATDDLVAFDLNEGGVLCRSDRRGRSLSPEALELLRRILGGGLASALREPAGELAEELTDLATEATEVHLDRRLRSVRAAPHVVSEPAFGVYVHVPFCSSRCDYCAFATWTDRDHLMERYAAACVTEIRRALTDEVMPAATSVFVGGGTPSRLPADLLAAVIDAVPRVEGAEVTVECNPEDASAERFARWRSAGVGRISFGVQSMVPHVLAGLGRRHDPDSVGAALALAGAAGFGSVNVDLIFGGAGETDDDFRASLDAVLALDPPPAHVSAYALTVEPGTPLAADVTRHPDEDVQAHRYAMADEVLGAAGYDWYEISNWARPGHACRHNRLYWEQGDYRGIGAAAHSHRHGRRWWNIRTPERYIAAVEGGRPATAGEEVLSPDQTVFEGLALALRTSRGVPASVVPDDDPDIAPLISRRHGRAVLTVRGRLLANEVTARLRPGHSEPTGILPP